MFLQRLITILILIPFVLLAIYFGNLLLFSIIVGVLTLSAGYEWLSLIPLNSIYAKGTFLSVLLLAMVGAYLYLQPWLLLGTIIWPLILVMLLTYPNSQKIWGYPWVVMVAGLIVLPLFFSTFLGIYRFPSGKALLVYVLGLVWAADIGAYVIGKFLGSHKLIPKVSPGKTYEGVLGGFVAAIAIAVIAYTYFNPSHKLAWFVLAMATIVISIIGDLFISMLKRRQKLKDSGHVFPGHGGVLDRLDSLIAAFPLFYLGMRYLSLGL